MNLDVLTIMAIVVIVAVIGHNMYYKIGLPESVFMIILGLTLGPFLNIVSAEYLTHIIPHVFTLSIVVILLESGLTTDIKEALETMRTTTVFTIIVLIVTTILCGAFLKLILGWSLIPSLILGVICSGTSTLPIIYFTSRMRLNPAVNQMLIYESIINDVTIITVISLILQAVMLDLNLIWTLFNIFRNLAITITLGVLFSTIWTLVLVKIDLKLISLKYLTTLAISMILHSLTESRGGSGVIAVMVFGITIGNLTDFFSSHLSVRKKVSTYYSNIEVMQDEVTFLVKNTFFFILGLMFNIHTLNISTLFIAIALTGLMIISRWVSYTAIGVIDKRYVDNIMIVSLMISRGLTAGITAYMPLTHGIEMPPITDIVIVMILFTNLVAISGFMMVTKEKLIVT